MSCQVLIVEDDREYQGFLARVLSESGYDVVTRSSGAEGLLFLEAQLPDILITDIVMPDIDGLDLIRKARERYAELKILAISGGGLIQADRYLDAARKMKADAILKKPFIAKVLLKKLAELMEE